MNPKRFNPANLEPTPLHEDDDGRYFILPAHSYGLGVALEKLRVPPNITVICLGKSTYARLGIIVNTTPAEASWEGHLTLEFSNSSGADCRIYADEGICQLLFFEGDPCATTYSDRQGKKYAYTAEQRGLDLNHCRQAAERYRDLLHAGFAEEHARGILPFDYRQHFVVSFSLRAFLHFMDLRAKLDAQLEIRQLCDLMWPHMVDWAPEFAAWYEKSRLHKARLAP